MQTGGVSSSATCVYLLAGSQDTSRGAHAAPPLWQAVGRVLQQDLAPAPADLLGVRRC